MGLTINYSIRSTAGNAGQAEQQVRQMRELALDLPFEEVGEILFLEGNDCDVEVQKERSDPTTFWLAVQGCQYIKSPWNDENLLSITPDRLMAFEIRPGPGSEPANQGLCTYPSQIQCEYRPELDSRFFEEYQPFGPGFTDRRFSQAKWERWLEEQGHDPRLKPNDERFVDNRWIETGLTGWLWQSFTKTQFASDPACGGMANFLRCHISVVTLMERIGKLPDIQVELHDDAEYGTYRQFKDARERTGNDGTDSIWHPGRYDPKALVAEVERWNGIVAAVAGVMKDAGAKSGMSSYSPIQNYPNFEKLEFRGSQDDKLRPFLALMQVWAKGMLEAIEKERQREKEESGEE